MAIALFTGDRKVEEKSCDGTLLIDVQEDTSAPVPVQVRICTADVYGFRQPPAEPVAFLMLYSEIFHFGYLL